MARKIKLSQNISISSSILLIVIGAFLIKYASSVLHIILFILGVTAASIGLGIIVNKFRYKRETKEFWVGFLMIVLGILLAIFTDAVAKVALLILGAIFVAFGIYVIAKNVNNKDWFPLTLGISRIVIGGALIGLSFAAGSGVFTMITGIVAVVLGVIFLTFEK